MKAKCPIIKAKCPESGACPCWHEVIMTNSANETKVKKDCLFRLLPEFLSEVIAASNRPAASIDMMRTEVFTGLGMIAQNVGRLRPTKSDVKRIDQGGLDG